MRWLFLGAAVLVLAGIAPGAEPERGITISPEIVYISPDAASARLVNLDRGREVVVLDHSKQWIHVLASVAGEHRIEDDRDRVAERDVTGWMLDQGVVRKDTPNGDRILFGEAAESESEASRRGGRRGAAQDAMNLYARMAEYFPNSPLAGEALYRAADIRWQIERDQISLRPSSREAEQRSPVEESRMRQVMKKFPHTKWDDLAAFHLLDNKMCGDWQGESKCPAKEAGVYEKYASERPQSPAAAEALYNAASRYAALIEIYKTENQPKKSDESRARALTVAQRIISQYGQQTDWAARAQRLVFLIEQNIPTYGNGAQ